MTAYRVTTQTVEEEADSAAHAVAHAMDRMRRLAAAYGEWTEFDAGAYFDLSGSQVTRLVTVAERVATVHVTFHADLLLPSFQQAESYWCETFWRMHRAMQAHLLATPAVESASDGIVPYFDDGQPKLVDRWRRLLSVIERARYFLREDPDFWSMDGAAEERWRWRHVWQGTPAPGLVNALQPPLEAVPTLTLTHDFPLPAHRQPGRLRRLRRLRTDRTRQRPGRLVAGEQVR